MSENQMTIYGNVGTPVDFRDNKGFARATFRLGSTPGYVDRQGEWRDLETLWVNVQVTKNLARNVAASVKVGEPVVVVGRLRTHAWRDEETKEIHQRNVLEATAVCHDLTRGTSAYQRNERPVAAEPVDSEAGSVRDLQQNDEVRPISA